MIYALLLFAATYVLMLAFQKYRPYIALASAVIFVISGMMPLGKVAEYVDLNVLLMIAGTMGTVALMIESKMPNLMADILLDRVPNVKWAIVALALFAGVVSAFIDNVATVLMIAPIGLAIAKKLNISPVPMIIAIAVSSNLQGAATLVGDTTAIMLGGYAGMNFLDFFFYQGKPGMDCSVFGYEDIFTHYKKSNDVIAACGHEPTIRGERLDIAQFVELSDKIGELLA